MATVKCKYCGKQFDRTKEPYIQVPYGEKSFRYGHGNCYIDAVNKQIEKVNILFGIQLLLQLVFGVIKLFFLINQK